MTAQGKPAEPMILVRRVRRVLLAAMFCCLFVAPSAQANLFGFFGLQQIQVQKERITIHQAVRQVKATHNGKVLGAETRVEQGRNVHIIKMITEDGVIKRIRMDAETGSMSDQ